MEHTRFDELTRTLGESRSRRGALRALAAAAAAAGLMRHQPARAQTGWLDLGDDCQSDQQCAEGVCDYVVQTADSRCCAYEGGRCGGDHMCCGSLVCGVGDFNGAFCERPQASCDWYGCHCQPALLGACGNGLTCCAVQSGYICVGADECPPAPCTGLGCPCVDVPGACDDGLMCCQSGALGADGLCVSVDVCYPEATSCTSWGCDCDFHLANPCDPGLMCCAVAGRFICAAGDACAG